MNNYLKRLCFAAILIAHLGPALYAEDTLEDNPPNVLFIAVGDLNTWALGLSDEYSAKTPHMNALANRGVLFSNLGTLATCGRIGCDERRRVAIFL